VMFLAYRSDERNEDEAETGQEGRSGQGSSQHQAVYVVRIFRTLSVKK
jgi:hypothetical protein